MQLPRRPGSGYPSGCPSCPTTERREMSEETQFWGVAVERYGLDGRPTNALLEFSGITPENKPFRGCRVFSSRERADRFLQRQWQRLSQDLLEQTVANIRQIRGCADRRVANVSTSDEEPI